MLLPVLDIVACMSYHFVYMLAIEAVFSPLEITVASGENTVAYCINFVFVVDIVLS